MFMSCLLVLERNRWRRCQALLQLKLHEQKLLEESGDQHLSSDEVGAMVMLCIFWVTAQEVPRYHLGASVREHPRNFTLDVIHNK